MNRHQRRASEARNRKQGTGYLARALAARPALRPGVHHLIVEHDDWCEIFRGGPCTCTPDMHRHADGSDMVEIIGVDGSVTRMQAN